MKEQLLSIDKFNNPKIIESIETDYTMVVRLIMLEPGTIKSHPDMGVGLVSNWRFCFEDQIPELKEEIELQISKYLPQLLTQEVQLGYRDGVLVIGIVLKKYTIEIGTSDFNSLYLVDVLN